MTGRERWLAVARREKVDRIPMDFWGTDEIRNKIKRHLGVATDDEMYRRLHIDRPVVVDPPYSGPPLGDDEDMWGVRYREMPYATGSTMFSVKRPASPSLPSPGSFHSS